MNIKSQVRQQLQSLMANPASLPTTVRMTDDDGITMAIDFSAIDSMSCAFSEITLEVPTLQNADAATLEQWARQLSQRVTYLLEQIGPIEIDPAANQVLIRSTPPDQQPDGTTFYEIMLSAHTGGTFTLRRYHAIKGIPGRTQVHMQVTHQVLEKLVQDLVDTIP